ncbi:MAG: peptidoglycan-binding protein [Oscillospiraceae bacterium]|nr:peptidoglycan-binding protein [Oscillospiraceae bacterium]
MQSYDKYIMSTGTHYISNSGKDENGTYHGGKAGDQSGHEWELKAWYSRPWTVILRYPDINVGLLIARLGCAAALNNKIGYDQYQRTTYWKQLQAAGYDPSRITEPCEEDCTAGVTANVKAAGYLMNIPKLKDLPTSVYSGSMRATFVNAGFKALTASKYTGSPNYLLPGDILLYEGHHAATNVTYGKNVRPSKAPETPAGTDAEGLRKGDSGEDVRTMQRLLLKWRPDCLPNYGADGDFGGETKKALMAFQADKNLPETGVYDEATRKALIEATTDLEPPAEDKKPAEDETPDIGPQTVVITGKSVNVRSAPGTDYKVLGVVHKHDTLPYGGVSKEIDGRAWYLVAYENQNGWVSSKYAKLGE